MPLAAAPTPQSLMTRERWGYYQQIEQKYYDVRFSVLIIFIGAPQAAPALAGSTFLPSDLLSDCGAARRQAPCSSSLKLAIVLNLLLFKLERSAPNPYGPPQPAVLIRKALHSPP